MRAQFGGDMVFGVNLATPFPKVYLVPLLPLGKVEPKHNKMIALFVGGDMVFGVN